MTDNIFMELLIITLAYASIFLIISFFGLNASYSKTTKLEEFEDRIVIQKLSQGVSLADIKRLWRIFFKSDNLVYYIVHIFTFVLSCLFCWFFYYSRINLSKEFIFYPFISYFSFSYLIFSLTLIAILSIGYYYLIVSSIIQYFWKSKRMEKYPDIVLMKKDKSIRIEDKIYKKEDILKINVESKVFKHKKGYSYGFSSVIVILFYNSRSLEIHRNISVDDSDLILDFFKEKKSFKYEENKEKHESSMFITNASYKLFNIVAIFYFILFLCNLVILMFG
jgi:hypothetical protein